MTQWFVLFHKELLDMWRSYKWVWVPLVFVVLGLMKPLSFYYLPQILETAGGLPEGASIDIPLPTGAEVLTQSLADFGVLGLLVLTLAAMGTVAQERKSGVAAIVLLKPVPYTSYVTAKWVSLLLLTWVALLCGYGASWYYTELLIGSVSPQRWFYSLLLYGFWLSFVVTVVVFYSVLMKNVGAVAFLSLSSVTVLSVATATFTKWLSWSPGQLTTHAYAVLAEGEVGDSFLAVTLCSIGVMVALLTVAIAIFRWKELVD